MLLGREQSRPYFERSRNMDKITNFSYSELQEILSRNFNNMICAKSTVDINNFYYVCITVLDLTWRKTWRDLTDRKEP